MKKLIVINNINNKIYVLKIIKAFAKKNMQVNITKFKISFFLRINCQTNFFGFLQNTT